MSLTTIPEVRAIVDTKLSDEDLQDVIDREEAWLARRVGPLTGPRTVVIPEPTRYAPVVLRRGTSEATVTDASADVDVTLVGQSLTRVDRLPWIGPVAVAYTPDDEDEVRRVVIELVRMALDRSAYQSETIGDYSYQRGDGMTPAALVRSLLPGASRPYTIGLHTSWYRR